MPHDQAEQIGLRCKHLQDLLTPDLRKKLMSEQAHRINVVGRYNRQDATQVVDTALRGIAMLEASTSSPYADAQIYEQTVIALHSRPTYKLGLQTRDERNVK